MPQLLSVTLDRDPEGGPLGILKCQGLLPDEGARMTSEGMRGLAAALVAAAEKCEVSDLRPETFSPWSRTFPLEVPTTALGSEVWIRLQELIRAVDHLAETDSDPEARMRLWQARDGIAPFRAQLLSPNGIEVLR